MGALRCLRCPMKGLFRSHDRGADEILETHARGENRRPGANDAPRDLKELEAHASFTGRENAELRRVVERRRVQVERKPAT